jgi:hypothetical protein
VPSTPSIKGALQEVRAFLTALAARVERPPIDLLSGLVAWREEEGTLTLDERETAQYTRCTAVLRDATYLAGTGVSKRALEGAVQRAIFVVLDMPRKRSPNVSERVNFAIEELGALLKSAPSLHRVVLRVEGLADDSVPWKVGEVEFAKFDESHARRFLQAMARPDVPESKDREELENVAGATVGIVEVDALDWRAAESLARAKLRRTLDVINFYSDLLPHNRGYLGLPGDGARVHVVVPQLKRKDDQRQSYHTNHYWVGPRSDLSLRKLSDADLRGGLGFAHVSRLLGERRTKFQEQLVSSLQWAGRATVLGLHERVQERRQEAFLLYAVALESFVLIEGDPGELSYRLRFRVAHLLGETAEERHALFERVGELYSVRSKIVHRGQLLVTDTDFWAMRRLTKSCLVRACTSDEFTGMREGKDLVDWFNSRLLGNERADE